MAGPAAHDPVRGSKTWGTARATPLPAIPPAIRTVPSARRIAVWPPWPASILATTVQDRVPGSYSSADERGPPATNTLPSGSSVAEVPSTRLSCIAPVAVQDLVVGSY